MLGSLNQIKKLRTRRMLLQMGVLLVLVVTAVTGSMVVFVRGDAHAAGGVFSMTIAPVTPSVASGDSVQFLINYSCSGATTADTCDDVYLTANFDAADWGGHTIGGSAQTVDHHFYSNEARWQFISSLPSGSSGQLQVSWRVPNYRTAPGQYAATVQQRSGSFDGAVVQDTSASVGVTATPDWMLRKIPDAASKITVGAPHTYTLQICYDRTKPANGRLGINDIVFTDQLPANATFVSAGGQGVYDQATHTVSWPALYKQEPLSDSGCSYLGAQKVTVRYDSPVNQAGDTVTNNGSFTAIPVGGGPITRNANVSNVLTNDFTFGALFSKGYYNQQRKVGDTASWQIFTLNQGNAALHGTITDALPCVDDKVAVSYSSPVTGPSAVCDRPVIDIKKIIVSNASSTNVTDPGKITAIRWWSNSGANGVYTPDIALPTGSDVITLTPTNLGVPAGDKLTALQYDFDLTAGDSGVSIIPGFYFNIEGPTDATLDTGDMATNTASINVHDDHGHSKQESSDASLQIVEDVACLQAGAVNPAGTGTIYRPTDTITWQVSVENCAYSSDTDRIDHFRPELYILMPDNLRYQSIDLASNNYQFNIGAPSLVELLDGQGSLAGKKILHVKWPQNKELYRMFNDQNNPYGVALTLKTIVEPNTPAGTYVYSGNIDNRLLVYGYAIGYEKGYGDYDTNDIDADGNTTETVAKGGEIWRVGSAATAFADTLVRGSEDSGLSFTGETIPRGENIYQVNLMNASNDGSVLKDFVFYATLPHKGDHYVSQSLASQSRGSTMDVHLTGPVSTNPNVEAKYSMSNNPCRDEVYPNSANTGCISDWVTADGVADWSKVEAIRFAVTGEYDQGEGELVTFPTRTESSARPGDKAFLSIAYRAYNVTQSAYLLPSEPSRTELFVASESTENTDGGSTQGPGGDNSPNAPDSGVWATSRPFVLALVLIMAATTSVLGGAILYRGHRKKF